MINMHHETDDPSYRYKMPMLLSRVEVSGSDINTAVVNMSAVAKALNCAPEYITKFFGFELGAQVEMNASDDRWIVNGAHDGDILQSLFGSFVKKFVLCENCENPETVLRVSKYGEILQKCQVCGQVSTVPIEHPLSHYITSHPPKSLADEKSEDEEREDEKDEDDKSVAEEPQKDDLSGHLEGLSFEDNKESAEVFLQFVKSNLGAIDKIFAEAERLEMTDKAPEIIIEILTTTEPDLNDLIGLYAPLLARFCKGNSRSENYILARLEQEIAKNPVIVQGTSFALMELYTYNLVSKDTFKAWSQKESEENLKSKELTKQVHAAAGCFMEWLNGTDEEGQEQQKETANKQNEDERDIDAI